MGIRNDITLNDAATTPVNHIFKPFRTEGDIIMFRDRTQAIYAGQNRLSVSQRVANKNARSNKISWRLETPILAVTSPSTGTGIQPQPTVDHTNLFSMDFVTHENSTLQERKDLLAMARDLIAEAILQLQIVDQDLIY